ncbi:hypothetical protein MVEG_06057 [Podila verticillata NRRL 6337]|nr:hypothetical protein MVEG_06057 [Podila verticillata NRRL 6337]
MAQAQLLVSLDSPEEAELNTPSSETAMQTLVPVTTSALKNTRNTPSTSTDKNTEECTASSCSSSTLTTRQLSQTQLHQPNPSLSLLLLTEDIPSIKWTAINDFSDLLTADPSSSPESGKKQVSGTKTKRGQNINNIYSTYSRGYQSKQPSPDPPHRSTRSLATQSTKNSAKSSSSFSSPSPSHSSASAVTAVVQSMRDLIQEQTSVSKTIANNTLHQDTNGSDHVEGDKNNSYPEELPVCPFTQDQLDAKYRDAMLPYLQKHFSPLEAISSILKMSVQHFRWCCGMWDYVPVGNTALDDPSTMPQKEYTRLVKVLKQLENEHRSSSLPKAENNNNGHYSLSRLQTPALSTCSSTASSTVSSPALMFSTPSTPIPNFELEGAYEGRFGSEQCGPNFDDKINNEIHKNKEKTKDKKTEDSTKEQTKDQLKDMTKLKVESEAKKNSAGKARGKAKEQTKSSKATDRPRDRWLPELDSSNVEKCGGNNSSNAAKVSAQEKTRNTPGKEDQRGAPNKRGPTVEASHKFVGQGIDKESLQDSTPQDQPTMLMTVPPVKDNGRETPTFEGHLRPPKHPLDGDDSSASLSTQGH